MNSSDFNLDRSSTRIRLEDHLLVANAELDRPLLRAAPLVRVQRLRALASEWRSVCSVEAWQLTAPRPLDLVALRAREPPPTAASAGGFVFKRLAVPQKRAVMAASARRSAV